MEENCTTDVISVASVLAPKLDIYAIQNYDKILHVYDAQLIRLLSEVFQVPYRVLTPLDGEFGSKQPDGNWTGIYGMVMRSETDLGVGGNSLRPAKFDDFNFSYPYIFTDYTFMTDKLKPVSKNVALLNPFPLKLWILLIVVIFLFSFLIYFLTNKIRTYPYLLLMTYGTVLEKSILIKLQNNSRRLLIGAWLIFIFVITNSYKALFLSFLTLPNFTGIRDIHDLTQAAQRNLITCYAFNKKFGSQKILQSGIDSWMSIGKCLQQNEFISHGAEESFIKAPPGKVFITGRIYLKPYKEKYLISEDSFYTVMYALLISRDFSCKKSYLNKMIHRLISGGIFDKLNRDEELQLELKLMHSHSNEPNVIKALQINDLIGAFLVLFSGYILSVIVFFTEIAVNFYFPDPSKTMTETFLRDIEREVF